MRIKISMQKQSILSLVMAVCCTVGILGGCSRELAGDETGIQSGDTDFVTVTATATDTVQTTMGESEQIEMPPETAKRGRALPTVQSYADEMAIRWIKKISYIEEGGQSAAHLPFARGCTPLLFWSGETDYSKKTSVYLLDVWLSTDGIDEECIKLAENEKIENGRYYPAGPSGRPLMIICEDGDQPVCRGMLSEYNESQLDADDIVGRVNAYKANFEKSLDMQADMFIFPDDGDGNNEEKRAEMLENGGFLFRYYGTTVIYAPPLDADDKWYSCYVSGKITAYAAYSSEKNAIAVHTMRNCDGVWRAAEVTTKGIGHGVMTDVAATSLYFSFLTPELGYMMAGNFSGMGHEDHYFWRTDDGGLSWAEVRGNLDDLYACRAVGFGMATEKIGYVCLNPPTTELVPAILMTQDGGATWEQRTDIPVLFADYADYPYRAAKSPVFDSFGDGEMEVSLWRTNEQGALDSRTVWLSSSDCGNTWHIYDRNREEFVNEVTVITGGTPDAYFVPLAVYGAKDTVAYPYSTGGNVYLMAYGSGDGVAVFGQTTRLTPGVYTEYRAFAVHVSPRYGISVTETTAYTPQEIYAAMKPYTGELPEKLSFGCTTGGSGEMLGGDIYTFVDGEAKLSSYQLGTDAGGTSVGSYQFNRTTGRLTMQLAFVSYSEEGLVQQPVREVNATLYQWENSLVFIYDETPRPQYPLIFPLDCT